MFRFENTNSFWLIVIIIILILVWIMSQISYKKKLKILGDLRLINQMIHNKSALKSTLKIILLLLCLIGLIFTIARPQIGMSTNKQKRNGIEMVIAIDVSNSMLTKDVSPTRLDRAKLMIEDLINSSHEDNIGIIVYAGEAFVQLPLTPDVMSAKMFLQSIHPSMISSQGTNTSSALQLSLESFSKKENIGRAIILFTDGEDHDGNALEVAKTIAKNNINLYVLGVGTTEGGPVEDENGNYIKDEKSNNVISRLNINQCQEIAKAGNGVFIHVNNVSQSRKLLEKEFDKLQKGSLDTVYYDEWGEWFQRFALISFILLLIEMFISNKNVSFKKFLLHKNKSIDNNKRLLLFIILFSSWSLCYAQSDRDYIRQGNKQYRAAKITLAEKKYKEALRKNNQNPQALYNLGCVYMQKQDNNGNVMGDSAVHYFSSAAKNETDKIRKAMSYHNIGVIYQTNHVYDSAIEAYKEALRNNPNDDETRYNLIICKKRQKQQQQNKSKQNNQNQNNKKQDNHKNNKNKNDNKQRQNPQKNENKKSQSKMSEENARAIIRAVQRDEYKTQQRIQKANQSSTKNKTNKNW